MEAHWLAVAVWVEEVSIVVWGFCSWPLSMRIALKQTKGDALKVSTKRITCTYGKHYVTFFAQPRSLPHRCHNRHDPRLTLKCCLLGSRKLLAQSPKCSKHAFDDSTCSCPKVGPATVGCEGWRHGRHHRLASSLSRRRKLRFLSIHKADDCSLIVAPLGRAEQFLVAGRRRRGHGGSLRPIGGCAATV